MHADFDLAVIGGGPAGASAALAAARLGLSVALFEPQGRVFDKPCGEGVMASGVTDLLELGLDDVVAAARPFPGLAYFVGDRAPLEIDFDAPGRALPRPALLAGFERALDACSGVVRFSEPVLRVHVQAADFAIDRQSEATIRARALVAADGASGRVSSALPGHASVARPGDRQRIGVRARCQAASALERVEIHLGRDCEVYLTPLPEGEINVAVLSESSSSTLAPRALYAAALAQHPRAARHLGALRTAPSARRLGQRAPKIVAGARWFRVGDAAGAVDPVVGCGLSIALATGIDAARCARAVLDGADPQSIARRYREFVRAETLVRRRLAAALRFLSRRRALGAFAVELLRNRPGIARRLAAVAAKGSVKVEKNSDCPA